MNYSWAVPGTKVVCIDERWYDPFNYTPPADVVFPDKDAVYTIREVVPASELHAPPHVRDKLFLRLVEIVNGPMAGFNKEPAFYIDSFRPLEKRSTDISVFQRIRLDALKGVKVPEDA